MIQNVIYIKTNEKSIIPKRIKGDLGPIKSNRYPANNEYNRMPNYPANE